MTAGFARTFLRCYELIQNSLLCQTSSLDPPVLEGGLCTPDRQEIRSKNAMVEQAPFVIHRRRFVLAAAGGVIALAAPSLLRAQ